jgi:membrane dipeptidase
VDRRTFLEATTGACVAVPFFLQGPVAARTSAAPRQSLIINGQGGIEDPNLRTTASAGVAGVADTDPYTERALKDALSSGVTAINFTVGSVAGTAEAFEATVRDIARTLALVRRHAGVLSIVQSAAEIRRLVGEPRIGLVLNFQNTLMLGTQADRVDVFANLGVKVVQLTYNPRNTVGDGAMEVENLGLTTFGREVVARLNRTRTMIDVSHSGERTCLDAIEASTRPVVISHAGCRALCDLPRNKSDRELKRMADRGGVVGIYFMPYLKADSQPDATDVVAHVEHAISVCGEDHVGIGTDGGTTAVDNLEAHRNAVAVEVAQRKAAGIGATGEKPGVVPFVPDLQGPGQFAKLRGLLEARGHSGARLDKIMGGNFLRVMEEVWGG